MQQLALPSILSPHKHTHTPFPCPLALDRLSGAGVCTHSLHKLLSNMAQSNKASQLQDNGVTLNYSTAAKYAHFQLPESR